MKKKLFAFIILYCFLVVHVFAQQNHFIFIQSDDKQTFSVELNNKLYNSASNGYLIIPKLVNGDYNFTVGFPEGKFPNQKFICTINNNDLGFALKNLGEKGWALVNFQTQEVLISGDPMIHTIDSSSTAKKENPFGEMLSDVVDDSTLTKSSGINISSSEKTVNENINITKKDSLPINESANDNNYNSTKGIIKASEIVSDKGTDLVFVDFNATSADTIKVFIPAIEAGNEIETNTDVKAIDKDTIIGNSENIAEIKTNKDSAINTTETNNANPNNPFFNSTQTIANQNNDSAQKISEQTKIAYKSDCAKMLNDNDFEKLKRKMFTEGSSEKMIQLAQKAIEGRCITTEQAKNLVIFFQNDESRYRFLDAVYNNVYDYSNFPTLENQLVDPYYKKRFLAMLK